ncbi:TusE/DsrC/DsvC family sulfur relay protein [Thiothrix eikelboomii]|uniref:TusE/DsrC/DsvC family sulfur relay protein n=1 Tax=Thiothrix eikelboomii TaxID=92487 RepID=UPI003BB1AFC2
MYSDITLDEMFPRAEPVMRPALPKLKVKNVYDLIERRAAKQQLVLTEEHREVIEFILDFYEHCDDCENARALADMLQDEFTPQGGRKFLYKLFPEGPLNTIHYLADLPPLKHQNDKSFGTRF